MTKKNNIPEIRFEGFSDAWEQRKLGDVLKYEQPQAYIVESTEYDSKNKTPVLTAGQSFVLGYTDEDFGIKEASSNSPVIIFDDFMTTTHYVDFPFKVKSSAMKLLTVRDEKKDDFYFSYLILESIDYTVQNHERHWISKFADFNILMPLHNEQQQIGSYFRNIDHLITLHQRKYDKLTKFKKSMLDKMFPKNGATVPEIRFKGFSDAWEQRKWIDTVDISTEMVDPKSGKYDELPHVAPGNIESFSGQLYDNVKLVKDENLISGKFHFYDGDIIYGKINPQLGKYVFARFEGLTSADAYVLNAKNGLVQEYLYSILQTRDFFDYSVAVSKRSGMPKINREELNAYSFCAPEFDEQKRIGELFLSLDNLITLHQRKLEKLKNIKKSCLEKMFTN